MEDWPAGLLVMGDALCNFDPIYGQGMTVAAIEAEMLDICLREQTNASALNFERTVLQRMQEAIDPAWWLSSAADLRWKGTQYVGAMPLKGVSFAQKYFDLYLKRAIKLVKEEHNPSMFLQFFMMNSLVISPQEVINVHVLNTLIQGDGSAEEEALLAELGDVEDEQKLQARLEELVPTFSLAYEQKVITSI